MLGHLCYETYALPTALQRPLSARCTTYFSNLLYTAQNVVDAKLAYATRKRGVFSCWWGACPALPACLGPARVCLVALVPRLSLHAGPSGRQRGAGGRI